MSVSSAATAATTATIRRAVILLALDFDLFYSILLVKDPIKVVVSLLKADPIFFDLSLSCFFICLSILKGANINDIIATYNPQSDCCLPSSINMADFRLCLCCSLLIDILLAYWNYQYQLIYCYWLYAISFGPGMNKSNGLDEWNTQKKEKNT